MSSENLGIIVTIGTMLFFGVPAFLTDSKKTRKICAGIGFLMIATGWIIQCVNQPKTKENAEPNTKQNYSDISSYKITPSDSTTLSKNIGIKDSPGSIATIDQKGDINIYQLAEKSQRSLSPEQREKFINILKTNKGAIEIHHLFGDNEANIFAHELKEIIESAGWDTGDSILQRKYHGRPLPGIIISIHSLEYSPSFAATLQQAFEAIGFVADGMANKNIQKNKVELIIGYYKSDSK